LRFTAFPKPKPSVVSGNPLRVMNETIVHYFCGNMKGAGIRLISLPLASCIEIKAINNNYKDCILERICNKRFTIEKLRMDIGLIFS
jgi:hypothetical protein